MAFLVGPVAVEPDGWPPSWLHAARSSFAAAPQPGVSSAAITVSYRGDRLPDGELGTAARGPSARAEELMQQRRVGGVWHVRSPGMFAAELDLGTRRCLVRSGDPSLEPELALKNPLRALLATLLPLEHDGLMIHACAGILDGAGVLVAGVSTAGKTTVALGFRRTIYLTDDVSLVGGVSAAPQLLASPFFGGAGFRGVEATAPLRAIGVLIGKELDPAKRTTFARVTQSQGCAALLRHVARFTKDRELSAHLLELTARLVERVPVVLIRRSLQDSSDDVVERLLDVAREQT